MAEISSVTLNLRQYIQVIEYFPQTRLHLFYDQRKSDFIYPALWQGKSQQAGNHFKRLNG